MLSEFSSVQKLNATELIELTEVGMVISVSLLQYPNASNPRELTLDGIV